RLARILFLPCLFSSLRPPPPPLFPYTTLFRSRRAAPPPDPRTACPAIPLPAPRDNSSRASASVHHLNPHRAGSPLDHAHGRLNRSEEHTSELQSRENLVCRLLLEKKNTQRVAT